MDTSLDPVKAKLAAEAIFDIIEAANQVHDLVSGHKPELAQLMARLSNEMGVLFRTAGLSIPPDPTTSDANMPSDFGPVQAPSGEGRPQPFGLRGTFMQQRPHETWCNTVIRVLSEDGRRALEELRTWQPTTAETAAQELMSLKAALAGWDTRVLNQIDVETRERTRRQTTLVPAIVFVPVSHAPGTDFGPSEVRHIVPVPYLPEAYSMEEGIPAATVRGNAGQASTGLVPEHRSTRAGSMRAPRTSMLSPFATDFVPGQRPVSGMTSILEGIADKLAAPSVQAEAEILGEASRASKTWAELAAEPKPSDSSKATATTIRTEPTAGPAAAPASTLASRLAKTIPTGPRAMIVTPASSANPRWVVITGLPAHISLPEITAQITSGPLVNVRVGRPNAAGLTSAHVLFLFEQGALKFVEKAGEESAFGPDVETKLSHLDNGATPVEDMIEPFIIHGDTSSGKSVARRRLTVVGQNLHLTVGKMHACVHIHAKVPRSEIEKLHVLNRGNVNIVFASVEAARRVHRFVNSNRKEDWQNARATYARDPCEPKEEKAQKEAE